MISNLVYHTDYSIREVLCDSFGIDTLSMNKFVSYTCRTDIHLDHAARARFDCGDRAACTEGTRIDVIQQITSWIGQFIDNHYHRAG